MLNLIRSIATVCCIGVNILSAQFLNRIHFFPESTYVSTFTADAHAHRMLVENIIFTKNERASMGGIFPVFNIDMFGFTAQANLGASVHFELHPMGQAHVVSNDYYIDYLLLDFPLRQNYFARFVTGHTSHHLSDNWYERMKLTSAIRYSRDYVKLLLIREAGIHDQLYFGGDYAYIFTVNGLRTFKRWTFQTGGKYAFASLFDRFVLYGAFDCKIRQEAGFAATNTLQTGIAIPMQYSRILRVALQYRFGLDERGQFYSEHRSISTIGLSIE